MSDDDPPKSDKEWKSSHERFVEALERFYMKMEKDAAKQERIANGFYLEVSRKELRDHLDARALFYSDEAMKLTEQGVQVSTDLPSIYRLADGSVIESAKVALEQAHAQRIENLNGKAKGFAFSAKHLPEGKEVFLLDVHMSQVLEFIPIV